MSNEKIIRPKEKDSILQSLKAGVVPRIGLHHIQVGRALEVNALIQDIERISDGGSSIRFIIGEYGAGKTFFLHLIKTIALEKSLVSAYADLTPDRRIHASAGQARNLYAELMRNISTRTKPDGGALSSIVERFVSSTLSEANNKNESVEVTILSKLEQLNEMVNGYDFAQVIAAYWKGYDTGNEQLKSDAIKWLRGEFTTKTDAKNALGVRTIIDDNNVYDQLKLMSKFIRLAGYKGFLIGIDEMVNLYKLSNTQARNANYEQILRILNDTLQGISIGLGFIMCGTPDFLMDTRKGLYSYSALQSRLAENKFAKTAGIIDYSGPVIRLANLTAEDLFVLLTKLRHLFALGDVNKYLMTDEGLKGFMLYCSKKVGDTYFRTPRTTIRAFIDLLSVLEQQPNIPLQDLLGGITIETDIPNEIDTMIEENMPVPNSTITTSLPENSDDELASFKL
jgi:hypothetical protein